MTEHKAPLSEDEVNEIADGVYKRQIFGDWDIPAGQEDMIGSIFMALMLMSNDQRKTLLKEGMAHVYEYMDKAAPRSINGFPMFFGFHTLTQSDFERVIARVKRIEAAIADLNKEPASADKRA